MAFSRNSVARARYDYYSDSIAGGTSIQSFPSTPQPHSCLMIFNTYDFKNIEGGCGLLSAGNGIRSGRQTANTVKLANKQNSIELPFPANLADATSLRINGFERDMLTEQIAKRVNGFIAEGDGTTLREGVGMIQGMGSATSNLLSSIGEGVSGQQVFNSVKGFGEKVMGANLGNIVSAAQYLMRSKLPGDVSKSIDIVTGQTINPRETLSFEGVNLRSHNLNWTLYPSNAEDSSRIKNIINTIKKNALPSVQNFAGIDRAFLRYPSTVDTFLLGVNSSHFIKYKTAMITGMNVDYGGGASVAFVKGGKPAAVSITIEMTELEIETADEYGGDSPVDLKETSDEAFLQSLSSGGGNAFPEGAQ